MGSIVLEISMRLAWAIVAGLFGLIFGSAINAIVWRLYVGRSWVHGRSECSECGHALQAKDLVPVLSWLALGGKCRYCRKPIKDHPIVELVTAILFGLSTWELLGAYGPTGAEPTVRWVFWLVVLVLLIVLAVYDARWLILPDKIMLPLIVVALVYSVAMASLTHSTQVLLGPLLAGVMAGGVFYAIVYFSKGRAMGGGDIKLALVMGLLLGLKGTLVAMLVAFNTAAIVGIVMIALRRRKRNDQIPFGPFLVGGTVVAFLYGQQLVAWYLSLNGLTGSL
jgi:leader peptidase (prepilin peptidase) / N-methyltransferase